MNDKVISGINCSAVLLALSLGACGGGATNDDIRTQQADCAAGSATACQLLGKSAPTTAAATALFTTAPSAITLASGGSATYTVGGGRAPYTATSGNTSVVTTTLSGTALTINGMTSSSIPVGFTGFLEPSPIAVVDSAGKSVTINVTVLPIGQTGIPPSLFPQSINAGDCTTNIPFVFTGGTSPFTVLTSDNFGVPVGPALPFGSNSYFTASIRNPTPPNGMFPYKATLTVLDGQSRTATAFITIDSTHACPANALLKTEPASANARVTEKLTFQITGGLPPYTVTSTNSPGFPENIATAAMNSNGTSFDVTANSTGGNPSKLTGPALITVKSEDKQQANIVFVVFPQPLVKP